MSSLPVISGNAGKETSQLLSRQPPLWSSPNLHPPEPALSLLRPSPDDRAIQYAIIPNFIAANAARHRNQSSPRTEISGPKQTIIIHIGIIVCLASFLGNLSFPFRFSLWVSTAI